MRIKKVSQYMQGGASLSNEYGESNENGYTQEYINEKVPEYELINLTKFQITNGTGRVYKYGKLCILYLQDVSSTTAISSGTIFTGVPKPTSDLVFMIHRTDNNAPTRLLLANTGDIRIYYSSIPGDANKPAYGFFTYITKE